MCGILQRDWAIIVCPGKCDKKSALYGLKAETTYNSPNKKLVCHLPGPRMFSIVFNRF